MMRPIAKQGMVRVLRDLGPTIAEEIITEEQALEILKSAKEITPCAGLRYYTHTIDLKWWMRLEQTPAARPKTTAKTTAKSKGRVKD